MNELLLAWYSQNGRDLSWRKTCDPYATALREAQHNKDAVRAYKLVYAALGAT